MAQNKGVGHMKEKVYKVMGSTGVIAIIVGIVLTTIGLACGIISIILGGNLLKNKEQILL